MCDLRIADGVVEQVGPDLGVDGASVIEVPAGFIVCPGFIDMHVHLREPGQEYKERISTGVEAAVAGGFVGVACMSNTNPVNDHRAVTELILRKAEAANLAHVYPIGAVTLGSKGKQLSEIGELHDAGCVAISDDGYPVADALLMRRALEYASMVEMPVIDHCEDPSLKGDGSVHEGYHASVLGLRGIPGEAEEVMVERDVTLSGLTDGSVHIAHMSTRGSLRAVRSGKERGINVTCEVTPHHFTLTDEELSYDTNYKMNPPLRDAGDREAIIQGLIDETIDVIATDHAPHTMEEKAQSYFDAPAGLPLVQHALLTLIEHVKNGVMSIEKVVQKTAHAPAKLFDVSHRGYLREGYWADLVIIDPDRETVVNDEPIHAKCGWSPFNDLTFRSRITHTLVNGELVYDDGELSRDSAALALAYER